ncbi:MAG: N-6 DNA methylase [Candidatus Thorarchaeota archaeon]
MKKEEVSIIVILGIWLLRFLSSKKNEVTNLNWIFSELEEKKKSSQDSLHLWQFLARMFGLFTEKMPETLVAVLNSNLDSFTDLIRDDVLGTILQRSLQKDKRKQLAANYTTFPASKVLSSVIPPKVYRRIIDPFCGSGRLVSTYLDTLSNETASPELIWINDSHPTAVLIAYSRIMLSLSKLPQVSTRLVATIGDAFVELMPDKVGTSFELVLMNPPFTRIHRIEKPQKKALLSLRRTYGKFLKGQPGLHVYAILLADQILSEKGTLGAILSGATLFSAYSQEIQTYLATEYQIDAILASITSKSFSEDSNLREVILVSQKHKPERTHKVKFYHVSNPLSEFNESSSLIQSVSLSNLAADWNWMRYFQPKSMIELRRRLLKTNKIKSGEKLRLQIVRGVEMYGPNFFFFPNKLWSQVVQTTEGITISSKTHSLKIPWPYIKKSLRKPGNYHGYITPDVEDFALSIPGNFNDILEMPIWLKEYIELTHQYAEPAKKKFGSNWVHHVFHQLETKRPWGHLFFVDKFGITTITNNVFFLEERITCTKNFYVLVNESLELAKFLAAWFNSSFYFFLFMCSRREIGGSFGRLQIIDYLQEPLFLDMSQSSFETINNIVKAFDKFRSKKLGSIPSQLFAQERIALDYAIAKALSLDNNEIPGLIENLHSILQLEFKKMQSRDRS